MKYFLTAAALLAWASIPPLAAQRLLWEQAFRKPGSVGQEGAMSVALAANQRFLLLGGYAPPMTGPGCPPRFRAYYRSYTLAGTLVREQLGRGLIICNTGYATTGPGVGWVTAAAAVCGGSATQRFARAYVQRVTLAGDTLPARSWYLGPTQPQAYPTDLLVQGNKIVTSGYVAGPNTNGQYQQVQLTCSDTLGRVRWQRSYPRLPFANDYAAAVVATPRGGYLLSGDAYSFATLNYDHYLIETDSAGLLRRSRVIQPLGSRYAGGSRFDTQCNVIALPNAGGYLLSGTADSVRNGVDNYVGYLMRLDTALNITWVYRHPPALSGTGSTMNFAYRLRLLPNGSVGMLLTDVRGAGTPDVFLVQVDVASGRRLGFYTLSSNTQQAVIPRDWQWVGDGTLLLAAQSRQLGVTLPQSYVARWDFRGTPLAARTAGEATALATFNLFPNPAAGPFTVQWQLPPTARAGQLRLYSALGQLVRSVALPPTASGRLAVSGLAPGCYVVRLVDVTGAGQGRAQRVAVGE